MKNFITMFTFARKLNFISGRVFLDHSFTHLNFVKTETIYCSIEDDRTQKKSREKFYHQLSCKLSWNKAFKFTKQE